MLLYIILNYIMHAYILHNYIHLPLQILAESRRWPIVPERQGHPYLILPKPQGLSLLFAGGQGSTRPQPKAPSLCHMSGVLWHTTTSHGWRPAPRFSICDSLEASCAGSPWTNCASRCSANCRKPKRPARFELQEAVRRRSQGVTL